MDREPGGTASSPEDAPAPAAGLVQLSRAEVCQALLDLFPTPRYLEIGVSEGTTFLPLRATEKVAVDPVYRFDWAAAEAAEPASRYHVMTSDDFFLTVVAPEERFQLIYLDGLHTFEQTLRDLNNVLLHLGPGGIVLIDDVVPSTYAAAMRELGVADVVRLTATPVDLSWMGDVYRLVFFIEQFMPAYSYATVAENHGQLVMWREPRAVSGDRTVEWVSRREFVDTIVRRDAFNILPFAEILGRIKQADAVGGRRVGSSAP